LSKKDSAPLELTFPIFQAVSQLGETGEEVRASIHHANAFHLEG
jgi:predicted RNase H-like HicB family nuclease